jgi:hypothetical protein
MRQRTHQMRLALLGIVATVFAMDSTFNSKQWHTQTEAHRINKAISRS